MTDVEKPTDRRKALVAVLIDQASSMALPIVGGRTPKIDAVVTVLNRFLDGLCSACRIAIQSSDTGLTQCFASKASLRTLCFGPRFSRCINPPVVAKLTCLVTKVRQPLHDETSEISELCLPSVEDLATALLQCFARFKID